MKEKRRRLNRAKRPGLTAAAALERAHRKVRETKFFLGYMVQTENQDATGFSSDPDVFPFFLSAFQAAGRSVMLTLKSGRLGTVLDEWQAGLDKNDRTLIDFMREERDNEIHLSGTTEEATREMVPITELRRPRDANPARGHLSFAPPETPPSTTSVIRHTYTFGESAERVTVIAGRYTGLLEQLVALADRATSVTDEVKRAVKAARERDAEKRQ
jgi:hypothetical protein